MKNLTCLSQQTQQQCLRVYWATFKVTIHAALDTPCRVCLLHVNLIGCGFVWSFSPADVRGGNCWPCQHGQSAIITTINTENVFLSTSDRRTAPQSLENTHTILPIPPPHKHIVTPSHTPHSLHHTSPFHRLRFKLTSSCCWKFRCFFARMLWTCFYEASWDITSQYIIRVKSNTV